MLPRMIVDEQAEVLENRTLSAEYNVVALGAAWVAPFCSLKQAEWTAYARHVSAWEVQQYADRF